MKNLIIIILAGILATSCNENPKEKDFNKLKSEMYASMYSMPSTESVRKVKSKDKTATRNDSISAFLLEAGKNMDFNAKTKMLSVGVDLIDFKKIPSIHRIMDSNTNHTFIGQIKEKEEYDWLIHDPDCPKCLLRQ